MSKKRSRKQARPRTKPVAKVAAPPAQAPSPPVMAQVDPDPAAGDEHGYLAIGLTAGALAVVAFLVVLILMAAN